jgi:hypothetical protein
MPNSYTNKIVFVTVLHLVSDAAKFTTGTTLLVDGGFDRSVIGAITERSL